MVRKDLAELIDFMQAVDKLYNGFADNWLCQLLHENSPVQLESEFDKSIKQRLGENLESLSRIPFIVSGKKFRKFFEIDASTPQNASADASYAKALAGDFSLKGNPFMAERRLTESVPPKNNRLTLQGDEPQPLVPASIPFNYT